MVESLGPGHTVSLTVELTMMMMMVVVVVGGHGVGW